jgi:hypothetical protein
MRVRFYPSVRVPWPLGLLIALIAVTVWLVSLYVRLLILLASLAVSAVRDLSTWNRQRRGIA